VGSARMCTTDERRSGSRGCLHQPPPSPHNINTRTLCRSPPLSTPQSIRTRFTCQTSIGTLRCGRLRCGAGQRAAAYVMLTNMLTRVREMRHAARKNLAHSARRACVRVCVCVLLRGALCCKMTGSSPLGVDTSSCTLSSSPSSSRSSSGAGRFDRGDVNESICLRGCSETSVRWFVCVSVCVRGGVRQQPTSVDGGIGHTCERWGR
jgi:hypothetical protein